MMQVRTAAPPDAPGIRNVHLAAFPTEAEACLVDQLLADGDAALSIVAVEEQTIVGHVLFSRMEVVADGGRIGALGLAPVAVLPDRQRRGIGSTLVRAGIEGGSALANEMIFVLGDPNFYSRFGFTVSAARPFSSPYSGPHFQALILADGRRKPRSGTATYARAFEAL